MEPGSWREILCLIVLLLLSGFFSMAETALTTVSKIKLRQLAADGDKKAAKAFHVVSEPKKLLSAILIGNNLVNLSASALTATITMKMFGVESTAVGVATAVLTFVVLVFCEITPKTMAAQSSLFISLLIAEPVSLLVFVCSPVVAVLNVVTGFMLRLIMGDKAVENPMVTEAELKVMLSVSTEEGVLMDDEEEMINNVFDFGDRVAKDVMTPRTDLTALPIDATFDEVREAFVSDRFSRLPVYNESLDDIVGVLSLKDLAFYAGDKSSFDIKAFMREPYFTYENKPTRELFADMRTNKGMAVVLDEYGGTSGIVTLEDLVEEIVGEISDEYDESEEEIETLSDSEYLVRGETRLEDINNLIGAHLKSDDFGSIGGYATGVLGRIAEPGDHFTEGDVTFTVMNVEKNRVTKLKIATAAGE